MSVGSKMKPNPVGRMVAEPDLKTMMRQRMRAIDIRDAPRFMKLESEGQERTSFHRETPFGGANSLGAGRSDTTDKGVVSESESSLIDWKESGKLIQKVRPWKTSRKHELQREKGRNRRADTDRLAVINLV